MVPERHERTRQQSLVPGEGIKVRGELGLIVLSLFSPWYQVRSGQSALEGLPSLQLLDELRDKSGLRTFVYGRISEKRKYPKGHF